MGQYRLHWGSLIPGITVDLFTRDGMFVEEVKDIILSGGNVNDLVDA